MLNITFDRKETLKLIQQKTGLYDQLNDAFQTRLFGVPLSAILSLKMEIDPDKIEQLIANGGLSIADLNTVGITLTEFTP